MIDRLFISFSGGETSAYMTHLLLTKWRDRFGDVRIAFANTGEENKETLEFVKRCETIFPEPVTWIESVPYAGQKKSSGFQVVSFETASRRGEPFEKFIQKYGVPNAAFPACTRELKKNPLNAFARSQWDDPYVTAIGIRADEVARKKDDSKIVYPLIDWQPITKRDVNAFWAKQSFRLELAGYQGNCKWCWKKSLRKHLTLMRENPEQFDFPERMEREYGFVGPEFQKPSPPIKGRVFFRQHLSTRDLKTVCANLDDSFVAAEDDSINYEDLNLSLDLEPDGCVESCEVF